MVEEEKRKNILNKERCGCPYRTGHYCNAQCGRFIPDLKCCIDIAINMNLGSIKKELEKLNEKLNNGNR